MAESTLNHFAFFAFQEPYWSLSTDERASFRDSFLSALRDSAPRVDLYQIFPARAEVDFLVWSAVPGDEPSSAAGFFGRFARAVGAQRRLLRPASTLWGFTRRSTYGSGSSSQEIEPFAEERKPYLIVYPFAKTVDWYLKSKDARQGMMNEHIRIGRQHPEIKQLLLYSFGLQDQEFVVVYETDDLAQFSELVVELRGSEARRYTLIDTPTFTAFHHPPEETLGLWG